MLLATEAGLGNGETPIFPIQIFRVKEGVNYNPGDPNYDLFKLAMPLLGEAPVPQLQLLGRAVQRCSTTRPARPETEIAYMGCRTRVMGNVYDPTTEDYPLAAATCPSPPSTCRAWPFRANGDLDLFFDQLDSASWRWSSDQLLTSASKSSARKKRVQLSPFLMGQGVWIDS